MVSPSILLALSTVVVLAAGDESCLLQTQANSDLLPANQAETKMAAELDSLNANGLANDPIDIGTTRYEENKLHVNGMPTPGEFRRANKEYRKYLKQLAKEGKTVEEDMADHAEHQQENARKDWKKYLAEGKRQEAVYQEQMTDFTKEAVLANDLVIADANGHRQSMETAPGIFEQVEEPWEACFPGEAVVQVEGKGDVQVADLTTGDRVLVEGGKFEPVLGFLHAIRSQAQTRFVTLTTARGEIRASTNHLLFVAGGSATPAEKLQVGDLLLADDSSSSPILAITWGVTRQGMWAPLTSAGSLVVDGMVASIYALPKVGPKPSHVAMQALLFPVRMFHRLGLASTEVQKEAGEEMHPFVAAVKFISA